MVFEIFQLIEIFFASSTSLLERPAALLYHIVSRLVYFSNWEFSLAFEDYETGKRKELWKGIDDIIYSNSDRNAKTS